MHSQVRSLSTALTGKQRSLAAPQWPTAKQSTLCLRHWGRQRTSTAGSEHGEGDGVQRGQGRGAQAECAHRAIYFLFCGEREPLQVCGREARYQIMYWKGRLGFVQGLGRGPWTREIRQIGLSTWIWQDPARQRKGLGIPIWGVRERRDPGFTQLSGLGSRLNVGCI